MVGMGLKNIDTESRRKKITFDSDDEGKEELITKRIKKEYIVSLKKS